MVCAHTVVFGSWKGDSTHGRPKRDRTPIERHLETVHPPDPNDGHTGPALTTSLKELREYLS